ncbi:MAG: GHKL domain-containing protein [Elusimicrobia bacterium]|nr:GHKL domain-containing protein [Elusimicrobiota bacterium]
MRLALNPIDHKRKTRVLISLVLAYALFFVFFQKDIKSPLLILSILPVIIAAWYFGTKLGIFFALLTFYINTALLNLTGNSGINIVFRFGGGIELAVFLIVGAVIGYLSEMNNRLRENMRKQNLMEEQLMQQSKLASIGKLAAGVAHELNNPLTTIMACNDLLKDSLKDDLTDDDEENMDMLIDSANRMKKIILDLRTFSRSGKKPKMEPSDLNSIIDDVVKIVESELQRNDITLEKKLGTIPSVQADKDKIMQVLINLINNSIDALEKRRNKKISISTRYNDDDKSVNIIIRDNGVGIDSKNNTHVFDPFFSTKQEERGVGLGLSIVHGIIKEHDGSISLSSQKGKYTEFTLTFRAQTQEKEE